MLSGRPFTQQERDKINPMRYLLTPDNFVFCFPDNNLAVTYGHMDWLLDMGL